jgi:hypothetical protein
MEEEIVFFLLQMTAPRHEIRAAFAPAGLTGWVYLEATMNEHLRNMLKLTPGVFRHFLDYKAITHEDGKKLLQLRQFVLPEYVGKWVQVRKGDYKGDVGYVLSAEPWGVRLLLIPRLPPPHNTYDSRLKRKRSRLHSEPTLFDHKSIGQRYDVMPDRVAEDVYTFKSYTFEHGLIVKSYDFYSVSTNVSCMPLNLFSFFWESQHPTLKKSVFPRPSEWHFAEGDEVYLSSDIQKKGTIRTVRPESADVDLASGGDLITAPLLHVHRVVRISDFVKVTGGTHQGLRGWVIEVEEVFALQHSATIILVADDTDTLYSHVEVCGVLDLKGYARYCAYLFQMLDVHVNLLVRTTPTFMFGKQPLPTVPIPRSERTPWIELTVIIIAAPHPLRTCRGVVKDVLCTQSTSSGLRVVIQLASLTMVVPITLDDDDVIEAKYAESDPVG